MKCAWPVAVSALLIGCHQAPSAPSSLAASAWGGDRITMTVAAASTHLEFDCAHGDIPGAFSFDASGQYQLQGTFVREHGGPIRVGETPDSHPAVYAGVVLGDTMTLSIRLTDTQELIGTFALARGAPGRIVKCL